MRVLFFILCFVVSLNAVSLKDYKPLVFEILDSKENIESKPTQIESSDKDSITNKDSTKNIESKSPQRRILELSNEYAKEQLTFVDTLQKYATTKEQQDFITHYKTYLQLLVMNVALQFYIENHSSKQKDLSKKESEFIKFINDFLQEQSDIIASFGDKFFIFLDFMKGNAEPCIGASCGHINEVFIIDNMLEYNKNKMSENIANYAINGYKYYILMQFEDSINYTFKKLDFSNVSQKNLEHKAMDMNNNKLLDIFINYLYTEYLQRLYADNFALGFLESGYKNLLLDTEFSPCFFPSMLGQKGKDVCMAEFFNITANDFYPGVIVTLDSKNCMIVTKSKDSTKPKIIKSPTNTDKMCKDIIQKFESVF
ncbi:hypothetical protein DCO58_12460 [Helicobacter saguini]|uniref:Uncharacterized protein n=1 Tax=Helicobacter saguini TaxID=1548018 RepID=A0A347VQL7_9HELI|nr:hypothetical protein [Helicobacter saguini]MWV60898.1 hypothetical protein [Helicobacter saguini]MWV68434.1 hypothetical protein [Helicobacter saguini]MWV70102.1 hypothetical protein [Helicobacter saguini]MWV72005.1 hypothetical protein [Helicobacter saguini]TLD93768.1 hypothetical protein LS64_008225 [Helicobacter saguini]